MAIYEVKYGQNIYDIAVEVYGDVMGIYNILSDNENINTSTVLSVGDTLNVFPSTENNFNQTNVAFFRDKTISNSENSFGENLEISGEIFGEIFTDASNEVRYLNDVTWSEHSAVKFESGNQSYIYFNERMSLNRDRNIAEVKFNVEVSPLIGEENILISDSESDSRISLYGTGENSFVIRFYASDNSLIFEDTYVKTINQDCKVSIETNIVLAEPIYKNIIIAVDENLFSFVDTSIDFSSNILGTSNVNNKSIQGLVKEVKFNKDLFEFNEGSGKFVSKK